MFLLRVGLWPALATALLPVIVALFHLLPSAHGTQPAAHHASHAIHAAAEAAPTAADDPDCHPPGAPCDEQPRRAPGHCPLCFWLQGIHALPAPDALPAPQPGRVALVLPWHRPQLVAIRHAIAAQPRAPPGSLAT
jgi:hypothetical protein